MLFRSEIVVAQSDGTPQQVSFVNSICTLQGGTHVETVLNTLSKYLLEKVAKKSKKIAGTELKPFHVKSHLWVFVNALIENPAFDSQTKERLTTKATSFGSKPDMSEAFLKRVHKLGIGQAALSWATAKADAKLLKKGSAGGRRGRIQGMAKLDDANNAGTKKSGNCTLILTEGDSAKSLALSGLSVVGVAF